VTVTETRYLPGSFFLTKISGRTGWWVGLAQAAGGIPSRWTHAGIVGEGGRTYEAGPGGVFVGRIDDLESKPHIVCDIPLQQMTQAPDVADVPDGQPREAWRRELGRRIAANAAEHLGTGYSFLDYLAVALLHVEKLLTGRPTGQSRWRVTSWVRRRVEDSGHMICSAFVDHVFTHMAYELFDDGRLPGDVTPSDLDQWIDEQEALR
jgi:hypothetical protein